jgi:hypothetical protein
MVADVAILDRLPHVLHLEPDPHDPGPLDVVGFGEGRTPYIRTNIPDNGPDSIEVAVYIVPAAAASAPPPGAPPPCVPSPGAPPL